MSRLIKRILHSLVFRVRKKYTRNIEYPLRESNWKKKRILKKEINEIIQRKIDAYSASCESLGFHKDDTESFDMLKRKLIYNKGNKNVCNIIGSGKSALKAMECYNKKQAYFSANFGALLDISYDVFLFEIGTSQHNKTLLPIISRLQHKAIYDSRIRPKLLLAKNIWEGKLDKKFVNEHYTSFSILRDIYMPNCQKLEDEGHLKLLFDYMFNTPKYFVLQVHTTVLTLVQLAVWSGYKEINIYGLEGKGLHFFHFDHNFQNKKLVDEIRKHLPAVDDNHIHIPGFRARNLIHPMAKYLKKKHQINLNLVN